LAISIRRERLEALDEAGLGAMGLANGEQPR